eukprot:TRINITY_DN2264_c0_g1_i1.p1 TRINITY_DN2264_c0_g1~~TRINITY_DN2264_c0_g1_i1.p1  ORF type:complete len:126 (-),score=22.89 TRINITY_DN2264_c0_g1_i1:144-521(-)
MIDKAGEIITQLSPEEKIEVINAHPRIGAPAQTLSALSYKEQGYANAPSAADQDLERVLEQLRRWNAEYETKFGFKFVVFVNGRSKAEVLKVLMQRYENGGKEDELKTGLQAMLDIARDRLKSRL